MSLVESTLRNEPHRFGLWPSVWKLLRLRVNIWWNSLKRSKLRNKIVTGVLALLLVGLMVFLFIASSWLLAFLKSPQLAEIIDPAQILAAIPTIVLTMAFFLVIMTNFGLLLQALYLSRDMDFLASSPIPMRAVFIAKLLEAILPNFALFCAFSLPVLFGLGAANGYSLLYYPLLVVILGVLALAAGGLASVLVMAVVRVVPARRVAEVLGVLGTLVSVLCGQTGNIINASNMNHADVGSAVAFFSRLDTPWSPLAWGGRGLTAIGRGEWLTGLGLSLLILALAGGVFAGTLFLAEHLYYTGWASMQGTTHHRRGRNGASRNRAALSAPDRQRQSLSRQGSLSAETTLTGAAPAEHDAPQSSVTVAAMPQRGRGWRLFPAPLRALIRKDFLVLRRDPRNLSQIITPFIVGFVMIFSTDSSIYASNATDGLHLANLGMYTLLLLALFVGWMLMINLATVAFSREGRNYWILKAAPIRPLHLLVSKFVVSYLPALALSLLFLALSYPLRRMNMASFPYAAWIVVMVMAGATGIALAFGIGGVRLDWDSPQRQKLRSSTGCLAIIAVAAFMLVDVGLFLAPPIVWELTSGHPSGFAAVLGLILGTIVGVLGVVLPLWAVTPRLARIGEEN